MKPEILVSIVTCCITLLGMFVAPRIAVRLSLKQFRSQKLYERKIAVYEDLIRSASQLQEYFGAIIGIMEGEPGFVNEEEADRAVKTLRGFMYSDGFLISKEAAQSIQNILFNLTPDKTAYSRQYLTTALEKSTEAVEQLKISANNDLS